MEAIRIIREMRVATDGNYPRFAIFENVTGVYSSNGGEDFRIVLEEFVKIAEPTATMPAMPGGKWPYADCYVGDGWSIAYRTFDTQHWPWTPQRRKRLYLVADLRGGCAEKILFEREGLRGDFAQGKRPWQGVTANAERSFGADDRNGDAAEGNKSAYVDQYLFENHAQDARTKGPLNICPIISAKYGSGGNNQPVIVKEDDIRSAGFKAGNGAQSRGIGWAEECSPTLTAGNSGTNRTPAICIKNGGTSTSFEEEARKNKGCGDAGICVEHMAFAQNQRNEVRDLNERAGALAANAGMKQQTYVMEKLVLDDQGGQQITVRNDGKSPTIRAQMHGNVPCVLQPDETAGCAETCKIVSDAENATGAAVCYSIGGYYSQGMLSDNPHAGVYEAKTSRTLDLNGGNPACNQGGICIVEPGNCAPGCETKENNAQVLCTAHGQANAEIMVDKAPCLNCNHEQPIVLRQGSFANYVQGNFGTLRASGGDYGGGTESLVLERKVRYIVRRLTPTECARLQGFPDRWGHP